jgi:hypothetical protein
MSSEAHSKHLHQYLLNLGRCGRREERAISVQRGGGRNAMDTNGPKAASGVTDSQIHHLSTDRNAQVLRRAVTSASADQSLEPLEFLFIQRLLVEPLNEPQATSSYPRVRRMKTQPIR